MKRSILLWILALVITLSSAYYQRKTGPTHPVDGAVNVENTIVQYSLTRSHGGDGDQPVTLVNPGGAVTGELAYKRYKTNDEWTRLPLERHGDTLRAWLPHQPPAGKLEYFIELDEQGRTHRIPDHESIVTRFKGAVPNWALIPHVIAMFLAMFVSTRAGLEAFSLKGRLRGLTIWATGLMLIGGIVFGPIVQKYAFGAFWTGFPFGTDLTDNKTLIAFIAWVVALAAVWSTERTARQPFRRWFVLAAAVVTLLVYLIPHSMMGSELDYTKLDAERARQHANPADAPASVDSTHNAQQPRSDTDTIHLDHSFDTP
ncbi:MAG: hypothetical protein KFF77_02950 [Bacteroidetes bacterium]|nr:hypothetical protein [Bacteroidota bacterium]